MKIPFLPRPSRKELMTRPLHVIARDFPETLEDFRVHGVSLDEVGDLTLDELDDHAMILDRLEASTAWRPGIASA
jgi:hypothetical protein